MEIAASIGLGFALAVDASVSSFSFGISAKTHTWTCPLKLALVTAAFQGLMPLIGFSAAESVVRHIAEWSHWIACAVFLALGLLYIFNALRERDDGEKNTCKCKNCVLRTWKGVFAIGLATSIDALAVGVGIACADGVATAAGTELPHSQIIYIPAAIFMGTTFLCVYAAFGASYFFRRFPAKILGVIAGLILVSLGIRAAFS